MKKISGKAKSIAAIVLAAILVLGCSFAYFTDYATTNASGTAGTVAVALDSGINLLDADGHDILNPGDMRDAGFTVTNMGNKSIDVRTTLALTALDRNGNAINFTGDAESQSEFDLYLRSDVEEVTGEGYKPLADAKPLAVKSINGNVITYAIADYSLNGNSDEYAEVETIDGVNAFAKTSDYVLVFKGEAGNDWQAATITMDVLVEAKQHEHTGAGWGIVAQESVTTGSITKDAVKAEDVITTGNANAPVAPTGPYKVRFMHKGQPVANSEFARVWCLDPETGADEDWYECDNGPTDAEGYYYLTETDVDGLIAIQESTGLDTCTMSEFGMARFTLDKDVYEYVVEFEDCADETHDGLCDICGTPVGGAGDGICDICGMDMDWHPGDPANHGCDNLVWEEGCGDGATYGMCANCTSMIPCQNGVDVQ